MQPFAVIEPPERSEPKPGPRRAINRHSRLTQALDIQDILTSAVKALKRDLEVETDKDTRTRLLVAIASAGRSWQGLQGEVSALRGQGRPKPVEARNAQPRKASRVSGPLRPAKPSSNTVQAPGPGPQASDTPAPAKPESLAPSDTASPAKPVE